MLIVEVKSGDNIDQALKKLKRKFQNAGVLRELRRRREFVKHSVKRRNEIIKAVYLQQKRRDEGEIG